jgi:6-pyruvoyltetrahydropterin/6-carboxytetrahydropterin synthase
MKLYYTNEFDAAHFLEGYKGPCAKMHGHTWTVEVELEGTPSEDGMIIDFAKLRDMVMQFDHCTINDNINVPATAENVAKIIYDTIVLNSNDRFIGPVLVRIWESDNAYVEYP